MGRKAANLSKVTTDRAIWIIGAPGRALDAAVSAQQGREIPMKSLLEYDFRHRPETRGNAL